MGKVSAFYALVAFISWGFSAFFDKFATDRLGNRGVWIWIIASIPGFIVYLAYLLIGESWGFMRSGVLWLFASAILNLFALVGYYLLVARTEISVAVSLTALYPAITAVLGFIFLHEQITAQRLLGILLALISIYLLSN